MKDKIFVFVFFCQKSEWCVWYMHDNDDDDDDGTYIRKTRG